LRLHPGLGTPLRQFEIVALIFPSGSLASLFTMA
jgi:hypothetical protein